MPHGGGPTSEKWPRQAWLLPLFVRADLDGVVARLDSRILLHAAEILVVDVAVVETVVTPVVRGVTFFSMLTKHEVQRSSRKNSPSFFLLLLHPVMRKKLRIFPIIFRASCRN